MGINDMAQLAQAERSFQNIRAHEYMLSGLHLADPERIDVRDPEIWSKLFFRRQCSDQR